MKLLICGYCGDIINLMLHYKECKCGRTAGAYINKDEAVYSGNWVRCFAIHNSQFYDAVNNYSLNCHFGDRVFIGWCVPPESPDGNFWRVENVKEHLNEKMIEEEEKAYEERVLAYEEEMEEKCQK